MAHDNVTDYAEDLADDLTAQPSFAMRAAKEAFEYAWREPDAERGYQRRLWGELFGTETQREAMREFLDR
jgi:hypothetical protein